MMPLRQILQKLDATERCLKWSKEIGQFRVMYAPHTMIKAQVLVDFIVEWNFLYKPTRVEIPH